LQLDYLLDSLFQGYNWYKFLDPCSSGSSVCWNLEMDI